MNNYYKKYILLLPIFVLIQVLVLNEVLFFTYINPYLYLALIISWPFNAPKWTLLIYAFILTFFIDLFEGHLGFHSTATVFIAFIKPSLSKIIIPHNILGETDEITLNKIGSKAFIVFSFLIIQIHNSILFLLEHLEINTHVLMKIFASSFVTLILVLILEIFRGTKK